MLVSAPDRCEGAGLLLHLGDQFVSLRQVFLPLTLFSSQLKQFFFGCHGATLSAFPSFDKPSRTPGLLANYENLKKPLYLAEVPGLNVVGHQTLLI